MTTLTITTPEGWDVVQASDLSFGFTGLFCEAMRAGDPEGVESAMRVAVTRAKRRLADQRDAERFRVAFSKALAEFTATPLDFKVQQTGWRHQRAAETERCQGGYSCSRAAKWAFEGTRPFKATVERLQWCTQHAVGGVHSVVQGRAREATGMKYGYVRVKDVAEDIKARLAALR